MTALLTKATAREQLVRLGLRPRGIPLDLAAAYVGLSPQLFLAEIERGVYPRPSRHGQAEHDRHKRCVWDVAALDRAMDRLSGLPTGAPASPGLDDVHADMMAAIDG